jgi:hypothetical protein
MSEMASLVSPAGGEPVLQRPSYLVFDARGTVYIPDPSAHAVAVLDREARLLRRIGRQGQGPGEMSWPTSVYFDGEERLVVLDPENQRRSWFEPSGEFVRSERFGDGTTITLTSNDDGFPVGSDAYLRLEWYHRPPLATDRGDRCVAEVVDGEGEVKVGLGRRRQHDDAHIADMLNSASLAASPTGRVVAGFRYSPEIEVYDLASGAHLLTITRELPFRPSEPAIEERVHTSPDGRSVIRRLEPVADEITLDVAVDGGGRIWALTMRVDAEGVTVLEDEDRLDEMVRLEVYDPGGTLIHTSPLDRPYSRIAFDPLGDLWLLERTYDVSLSRYEVRWP